MNRSDLLKKLEEFKKVSGEKYGIESIGVFGSFARNQDSVCSDADIVIKTKIPDPFAIVHIKEELEGVLKIPVDIVRFREKMNPFLKRRIKKEAIYVR
ncbi:MAG: nucleotidyltransferase domain-containing protein [Desulfuromonadales bacterium]|nr:nucleotidyltransferase domain-containing protein [Desulfuromonadales bacterium]